MASPVRYKKIEDSLNAQKKPHRSTMRLFEKFADQNLQRSTSNKQRLLR
jgi:hypothetical protein